MPWTVIRRDFTHAESVPCVFGNHQLTSGVAYVVHDENGNVGFAGRTCVQRTVNYDTDIATIPNFTASTYVEAVGGGNGGGGNGGGNAVDDRQMAITYLLLRFERLQHYRILARSNLGALTQIYDRYQIDPNIPEADVNYLIACANNTTNYVRFNLRNLMAFYNLDNLCKIIGRSNHQNLLPQDRLDTDRIARDLYANTQVPPVDIQIINQILLNIESRYRMRVGAFQ